MARVLTVADVFESMASNRPYRPALPMKFALDELRDHRGTRYDEAAVNALLAMVERGYKIPA